MTVAKMAGHQRRLIRRVLLQESPSCYWCSRRLDESTATIEHFIPWSYGGTHRIANLTLACHRCNTGRNDRTPTAEEYRQWKARDRSWAIEEYERLKQIAFKERFRRRQLGSSPGE